MWTEEWITYNVKSLTKTEGNWGTLQKWTGNCLWWTGNKWLQAIKGEDRWSLLNKCLYLHSHGFKPSVRESKYSHIVTVCLDSSLYMCIQQTKQNLVTLYIPIDWSILPLGIKVQKSKHFIFNYIDCSIACVRDRSKNLMS